MKRTYHTMDKQGKANAQRLGEFLSRNGQRLLPSPLGEALFMAWGILKQSAGFASGQRPEYRLSPLSGVNYFSDYGRRDDRQLSVASRTGQKHHLGCNRRLCRSDSEKQQGRRR